MKIKNQQIFVRERGLTEIDQSLHINIDSSLCVNEE